jgi:hypothetical protein
MNHEQLFDLYTDYLISAFGPTTATGLSRLLDGQISHDQVTRLLAEPPQNSADLWRNVKPLVRHIERPEATLSVDDSIGGKPFTDENDIICWHWSHSLDRHVKGIEFLTAFYHVGDVSLPIAFDLVEKTEPYVDAKTGQTKRRSPVTKNQRYGMLLRIAVHNQVPFQYVLNDSVVRLRRQYEVRQTRPPQGLHHAAQKQPQGCHQRSRQTPRSVCSSQHPRHTSTHDP